ncbi:MAG: SRPBCC domain-containing protein [Actinomycetota bacterium]
MTTLPPIHREVLVDAVPDVAFAIFTERIARWWPLDGLSVFGKDSTVAFTAGALTERSADGQAAEWGTVTSWHPPAELSLTWHPGSDDESASQVTVTFTAVGAQTLVVIEHSGWDVFADPTAARAEYDHGWPEVMRLYQEFAGAPAGQAGAAGDTVAGHTVAGDPAAGETVGGEDAGAGDDDGRDDDGGDDDGAVWVALLHRPGPAAPGDGTSLFAQPQFRQHVDFLGRMAADGYLVAAGPLPDQAGEGMTILRVPGPGGLAEATRLATQEDPSVVSGFFTVTVRPWQVMLTAAALGG